MNRNIARVSEFAVLFFGVPTLIRMGFLPRIYIIWVLLAVAFVCAMVLLADKKFDRTCLWNARAIRPRLAGMLIRFGIASLLLGLWVWLFKPDDFLWLVRTEPRLWFYVMLLYPLFSVYPQELVYRVFLFHRYEGAFSRRWATIAASAVAFGYMHILFENSLAVVLSTAGGLLFALTYDRTRSAFAASLEHGLYGDFIFTIGLGLYFFHGAV